MVQIKVDTAARKNYGNRRKTKDIKYLVIHYTGNDGDSAKGNANYFKTHIVEASAHYFVDDNGIIQSVPDDFTAYSVGGRKYPSCGKTGGGRVLRQMHKREQHKRGALRHQKEREV